MSVCGFLTWIFVAKIRNLHELAKDYLQKLSDEQIAACYTSDIKWRNNAIPTDDEIDQQILRHLSPPNFFFTKYQKVTLFFINN